MKAMGKADGAAPKKRGRPRKTEAAAPTKKRQRKRKTSWDYEDNDGDGDFLNDSGGEDSEPPVAKQPPKKRPGRPRKDPKAEGKTTAAVKRKRTVKKTADSDADDENEDRETLEDKHRSRRAQYETDSERLLQEVRALALAEKKMQEKLIEKLKKDVTTLSKQAEEERKRRKKEVDRLVAERMREYDEKQRDRDDGDVEKKALKMQVKDLEAQFASFKRSTGPDDVVTVNSAAASASMAMKNSEAIIQLALANKLLEMYRLVTSTDIQLIESEADDQDDNITDISCTATDSATGNQLKFDLAVPANVSSEIDYLPSENPPPNLKVPKYFQEDLSFNRSEMTKFIRSILDVVIRQKKAGELGK